MRIHRARHDIHHVCDKRSGPVIIIYPVSIDVVGREVDWISISNDNGNISTSYVINPRLVTQLAWRDAASDVHESLRQAGAGVAGRQGLPYHAILTVCSQFTRQGLALVPAWGQCEHFLLDTVGGVNRVQQYR